MDIPLALQNGIAVGISCGKRMNLAGQRIVLGQGIFSLQNDSDPSGIVDIRAYRILAVGQEEPPTVLILTELVDNPVIPLTALMTDIQQAAGLQSISE